MSIRCSASHLRRARRRASSGVGRGSKGGGAGGAQCGDSGEVLGAAQRGGLRRGAAAVTAAAPPGMHRRGGGAIVNGPRDGGRLAPPGGEVYTASARRLVPVGGP